MRGACGSTRSIGDAVRASGSPAAAACRAPAQVAALRDLRRVLASALGRSANSACHLRLRLEVLLAREALDAPRVGQHLAFGDADARLVRLVVVGRRGTAPDASPPPAGCSSRGQRHRGAHMRLVARQAGALQLDVEAAAGTAPRAAAPAPRARASSPGQQRLPDARRCRRPTARSAPRCSSPSQSHLTQACAALRVARPARAPAARTG